MDSVKIYGRIPSSVLKRALYQATLKSVLGFILFFFGGITFIFGLCLIAWGFIPYRHLRKLSLSPPYLDLSEEGLTYSDGDKKSFISYQEIQKLDYQNDNILINDQSLPYFSLKSFQGLKQILETEED